MKEYISNDHFKIYQGSMLELLEVINPNTIDSVVTDPPYELNFMNKGLDRSGIAFQKETWDKCYQALKPGGYLLAFGGSRTFHRIAVAIEDAGFVKDGKLYHRYLTPEETWLLQGFDIEVFDRVAATGIPTRDLYMLAGNSIPVPVLEAIFKELLLKKE